MFDSALFPIAQFHIQTSQEVVTMWGLKLRFVLGLSQVHDPGEEVLDPLVARLTAQVSGMRARSICALLWSLAVLCRLSPTLFATAIFHLHLRPLPCFEHVVRQQTIADNKHDGWPICVSSVLQEVQVCWKGL